jgi:hypothetical protein
MARTVRAHMADARAAEAGSELRVIFHGPPLEILRRVYEELTVAGVVELEGLPVLLQVPHLPTGAINPGIGASGICDDGHLLDLRNSPRQSSFLALVPPGQHANRSVASTTDEFGVAAIHNGQNVPFDDWLSDPFIQRCVDGVLSPLSPSLHGDARKLLIGALRAVDDVDQLKASRAAAWRLLSRMSAACNEKQHVARAISLACGVPPMADDKLSAEEQRSAVEGIASALSDGFQSGLLGARENAAGKADVLEWLDGFLMHIRKTCEVPTALERSPEAFYAPALGVALEPPPLWWSGLTTDIWMELLEDEPDVFGEFTLECHHTLIPPARGVPLLVQSAIDLTIRVNGQDGQPVSVILERSPGKNKDGFPFLIEVEGEREFQDPAPPLHKSPVQYKAKADQFKPATIKVVSLDHWEPGIFVACRLARKVTAPKAPARKSKEAQWETNISLPGPGRFELLVFLRPGAVIGSEVVGTSSADTSGVLETAALTVHEVRAGVHQIEVEAEGAYQIDISYERPDKSGALVPEICRVYLTCDDVVEDGCRSEFERLIKLNRRQIEPGSTKPAVQLNRSARSTSLQGWMLLPEHVECSYLPLVLANDYSEHWVQPNWKEENGRILSRGRYLQDPRPPASEFQPPADFVKSRKRLAEIVRGSDEQSGLWEGAQLGELLRSNDEYQSLVESYLDSYMAWLSSSPDVAGWADVIAITSLDDARSLERIPDAILLSPLHPLRVGWHSVAQRILAEAAASDRPCPAAGVLDPKTIPDLLRLPVRSPEGIDWLPFLSVECNSDYWTVLWNGAKLRDLSKRSKLAPFEAAFGLTVGGISTGFSASQVIRALDDVSNVLCAKPIISVVVSSAGGTTDSCNQGLIDWSARSYANVEKSARHPAVGQRRLDVFDVRDPASRPDEATVANLSEDTTNNVRWFLKPPESRAVDLGIIAQLDSSEPTTTEIAPRTPLGAGGLLRHRVRKQLPKAFLSESRQSIPAIPCGDPLADKVAACLAAMENSGDRAIGLRFAPNVHAIEEMLQDRAADFVAVSSSAVDPACFLGGWLKEAYLWDYDLPSYSQRAGDTNGYYVLSKVKPSDRDGMKRVLSRLPGCQSLQDTQVEHILLEVARRGIPTIRGLSGDDTGATGDLGLFVAARLLQDRFRLNESANSIVPVIGKSNDQPMIALVIPVDPFRGYLDDLSRVFNRDLADPSLARPDLIVVTVSLGERGARLRITPVEVKSRMGTVFSKADAVEALGQAKALGNLLHRLSQEKDALSAWKLAYQHLLLSIIGFGMRVYSQHRDLAGDASEWAGFHERIASAILSDDESVTIDRRGRLIVVDDSAISLPKDQDGDGFEETIVIGLADAGRVIAKDSQAFYDSVRAKVGEWQLTMWPKDEAKGGGVSPPEPTPKPAVPPQTGNSSVAPAHHPQPPTPPDLSAVIPAIPVEENADGQGIKLAIGRLEKAFDPKDIELVVSDTRLNNLNMGVVGDLGTGKTQLLKSLVYQIVTSTNKNRGIRPRIMIFDYKRDYSSADFVAATGARVVRPHKIPLNLFDTSTMEDTTVPWLDRFRFFADVLDKIYSGIGPVQRDKLKRAVRSAYESDGQRMPTIYDVHHAYAELLDGKSDSPMAIIDDLVDMEIFERDPAKTLTFDSFLDGVVVVSLDALGQDDRSKNMLVAVMLNMFYENMLRTPKRPFIGTDPQLRAIDSYLLVDEADNIMRYEFDVLRKLLLQGREFGCGVILASQYLRHFKVNATDYREPLLTWFVHKVPNVTPAELSALGLAATAAELAERVKELPNHHCLYKTFDTAGNIIKGLPFYELVKRQEGGTSG